MCAGSLNILLADSWHVLVVPFTQGRLITRLEEPCVKLMIGVARQVDLAHA
jgi:hypothetical protein